MIRLIALDLDGTLLNRDKEISAANRAALREAMARGVYVTIATGRVMDSARHFGCQLVIATHSPVLLAMQDALIYDLDAHPVATRDWTQLENVRLLRGFFEEHRAEFA